MAAVIADHVPPRNADFSGTNYSGTDYLGTDFPNTNYSGTDFSVAAKQQCLFPALRCLLFGWTLM
jgi:uncharacterized protein YjbI with pentapeptide repeats